MQGKGGYKNNYLRYKNNYLPKIVLNNLKEASIEAFKNSENGDVILLSPACASWDQYKSFEERGDERSVRQERSESMGMPQLRSHRSGHQSS